ncbi:MAG: hypothetical protein ABJO05_13330, partial [Roseibium sp.]
FKAKARSFDEIGVLVAHETSCIRWPLAGLWPLPCKLGSASVSNIGDRGGISSSNRGSPLA